MAATLALFCRWCPRKLNCISSRYRHEGMMHSKEKNANESSVLEPDSSYFVKCDVCSIYSGRDFLDIRSHNSSEHHLRKLSAPAPKPPRRTLQPSQLEKIPRPPPPRIPVEDDSAVTTYPRSHAAESAAAAAAAPAAEAPTPASVAEEPPFGNMNQRFEESAFDFNVAGNFNVIRDVNDC